MRGRAQDRVPPAPGRGAVRGALIGFAVTAIAVTLLGRWAGFALAEAATIGLFVGSWGGCGFGAMLGGTIAFVRAEDRARAEAEASRHREVGPTNTVRADGSDEAAAVAGDRDASSR